MARFRYIYLFGAFLLLILTVAASSAFGRGWWLQLIVSSAFLAMLIVGALASSESGIARRVTLGLAAVTVVLRVWLEFSNNLLLEAVTYAVVIAVLCAVAALTIRHLLKSREVTTDALAASLCAYGFLVAVWAAAYSLLELVQPGSFSYPGFSELQREMRFGLGESATALYFSFVTITTLGYGDIVPATDASRLLAATEAFLGQAYIAILVAKLVGQYVVSASKAGGD